VGKDLQSERQQTRNGHNSEANAALDSAARGKRAGRRVARAGVSRCGERGVGTRVAGRVAGGGVAGSGITVGVAGDGDDGGGHVYLNIAAAGSLNGVALNRRALDGVTTGGIAAARSDLGGGGGFSGAGLGNVDGCREPLGRGDGGSRLLWVATGRITTSRLGLGHRADGGAHGDDNGGGLARGSLDTGGRVDGRGGVDRSSAATSSRISVTRSSGAGVVVGS
jgi:hypothetical protein